MKRNEIILKKNIKLISIYIFNSNSAICAINNIYSNIHKFGIKTELVKITSISFSIAVDKEQDLSSFLKTLSGFSEVRIRENLAVIHIKENNSAPDFLSDIFTSLNEEELRMVHYRFDSKTVTLIADEEKLDNICIKIWGEKAETLL